MEPRRERARLNGMRIAPLLLAVALVSCADPLAAPPEQNAPEYEADAFVIQEKGDTPKLCLGAVTASLPPHCGDVPITNWDWGLVTDEQEHPEATWGSYHVQGTYDGKRFTLTAKPEPPAGSEYEPSPSVGIACEEPAGGWVAPDPARATEATRQRTIDRAEAHPDFAGLWIGHVEEAPTEVEDPATIVLNIAFTRALDARRKELRETWGGSLCLVRYERSMKELEQIRDDLMDGGAEELGLQMLSIGAAGDRNVVDLEVVLVYPDTESKLEQRYGTGTVDVSGRLRPVAG